MAVADDAVAVFQFLQAGHPAETNPGAGYLILDFPYDLFVRRDLHHAMTVARGDEGVAILEPNGAVYRGLDEVIPNDLAFAVVLDDDTGILGADEQGALRRVARPTCAACAAGLEGELVDKLAGFVHLDDAAYAALDNHRVAVR